MSSLIRAVRDGLYIVSQSAAAVQKAGLGSAPVRAPVRPAAITIYSDGRVLEHEEAA